MSQRDDEIFDSKLREHWGVPPPATPELRARVLGIATDHKVRWLTRRRQLFAIAAAALLVAVVPAGMRIFRPFLDPQPVADELVWFDSAEDDDVDMDVTALFALAEITDGEQ